MAPIVITLLVVVLLILVIGYFAMRFLRAEDNDPFDEVDEDRGRSRGGSPEDHDWHGDGRVVPLAGRSGRGGRSSRGLADESPARRPDRFGRGDREPARADRDYPDREYAADRPARFDDRGFDDRAPHGGQRPAAAADPRGGGERPQPPRPAGRAAAASARNGRAKGSDPSGTDWDSLSDVDYWAELSSDKSLNITPQQGAGPSRPDRDPQTDPRQAPAARSARPGSPAEESTALLPVRRRGTSGPADSPLPPAVNGGRGAGTDTSPGRGGRPAVPGGQPGRVSAQGRDMSAGRPGSPGPAPRRQRDFPPTPYDDPRRPGQASRDPEQGMAALARLGNGGGRPAPLDDDPLTSPSFPAVSAADSRSYRGGRPDAPPPGSRASGGYATPGQQGPVYPAAAADPLSGYDSRQSAGRRPRRGQSGAGQPGPVQPGGVQPGSVQSGGGPGDWVAGYGQQPAGAGDSTGPNSYGAAPPRSAPPRSVPPGSVPPGSVPPGSAPPPAPAAAGYRDYGEQAAVPTGNPYGSYVSEPAESYPAPAAAAGRQDSGAGYPSYLTGQQETQQYSQPAGRHGAPAPVTPVHAAPVHGAPIHAAPVPDPSADPSAAGYGDAGYGGNWYGTPGKGGYADQPGSLPTGSLLEPGAGSHRQPAADSYETGGQAQPEYPPAAYNGGPYDQTAYRQTDAAGIPQDQHGYGTPDSGYGTEAYGGYPGY